MNNLIEKVDTLKNILNSQEEIKKIRSLNKEIQLDKKLISQINNFKTSQDENIKKQITSNELFKEYKNLETEINLIILGINQKLKEITNKGKCNL